MLAALRQNTTKCLTFIIMYYELLPETLPLRIFASLPSSLHMLYPMGKDQRLRETFDPHDSHSFKSETMNVQFRSSRVAPPETCDVFSECWAKVIYLQLWAIDWGNRFNQMIAALQTETDDSNLPSLDKSITTLLSLGILLHPSSLVHKWTVWIFAWYFTYMAFLVTGLPTKRQ